MIIEAKNIQENPTNTLRRLGYTFQHKVKGSEEMSFIRPMASAGYPRFHIYTKLSGSDLTINIHLDQKKGTYGEDTRHHGEYENDGALKEEVRRLKTFLE